MMEEKKKTEGGVAAEDAGKQWFAMRDLTRSNARMPAYRMLEERQIRCFTPMTRRLIVRKGKRMRADVPFMHDLVFVFDTRERIDPVVEKVRTFQYRYLRGTNREPMTVRTEEMERFIRAVSSVDSPRYFRPEEITPAMCRHRIRLVDGPLSGYEGFLLTIRGSKAKRLLVEIPSLLAAAVEVLPEYIELLD